jgi:hypothetical protein
MFSVNDLDLTQRLLSIVETFGKADLTEQEPIPYISLERLYQKSRKFHNDGRFYSDPRSDSKVGMFTVVLDADETVVHAKVDASKPDKPSEISVRPGIIDFLMALNEIKMLPIAEDWFTVKLWTAGINSHAKSIVDILEQRTSNKVFDSIISAGSLDTPSTWNRYHKDLNMLPSSDAVVLIDDSSVHKPGNGNKALISPHPYKSTNPDNDPCLEKYLKAICHGLLQAAVYQDVDVFNQAVWNHLSSDMKSKGQHTAAGEFIPSSQEYSYTGITCSSVTLHNGKCSLPLAVRRPVITSYSLAEEDALQVIDSDRFKKTI